MEGSTERGVRAPNCCLYHRASHMCSHKFGTVNKHHLPAHQPVSPSPAGTLGAGHGRPGRSAAQKKSCAPRPTFLCASPPRFDLRPLSPLSTTPASPTAARASADQLGSLDRRSFPAPRRHSRARTNSGRPAQSERLAASSDSRNTAGAGRAAPTGAGEFGLSLWRFVRQLDDREGTRGAG